MNGRMVHWLTKWIVKARPMHYITPTFWTRLPLHLEWFFGDSPQRLNQGSLNLDLTGKED